MSNKMMGLQDFHRAHLNLAAKDLILDVRNPDEYQAAHIMGAKNIPLPEVTNHAQELTQYDHVYIHCKRGGRAKTAFEALQNAGLTNLVCIYDAGMDAWIEAGYEVQRG